MAPSRNPQELVPLAAEAQRAELDAMVGRLAKSPRLAKLLRFIGERYFRGDGDQLREYEIATAVFDRPETFDATEDAIARVEAHRLRKKLKEYYESEGRNNPVQISLPRGTYALRFIERAESASAIFSSDKVVVTPLVVSPLTVVEAAESPRLWKGWLLVWAVFAVVVVAVGVGLRERYRDRTKSVAVAQPMATAAALASGPVAGGISDSVRILAGYEGQPHVDPAGDVWGPDRFFTGGRPGNNAVPFVGRTNDPTLFATLRTGEFSYAIPVKPGVYELHLYFVEFQYGPGLGGGELSRTFTIKLNDAMAMGGFDIESDANGPNIADERVFRNVEPAKDGRIHLAFESERGQPILSALRLVPADANRQLPVRLIAQPMSVTDRAGNRWLPDNYYLGGQTSIRRPAVAQTSDPELYAMERFGHFSYAIPVDPAGRYTAVLHFAEFYFGPDAAGHGGIGSRRFDVTCNGVYLLHDLDIFKEAGNLSALTKTFRHLAPTAQGKLNFSFEPIANYATISGLEVLDENEKP